MLYCVHSATTFFIFSICAFISLFTCLFCLPICDFDLSFYMYVCIYIYTKWKTYLEFHNEYFFFCYTLPSLIPSSGFVPESIYVFLKLKIKIKIQFLKTYFLHSHCNLYSHMQKHRWY